MSAVSETAPGLRDKLRSEIMAASWPELRYQFARGGLFLVAAAADLLEVAEAIASDDRARVELLLADASLRRVTDDDARVFEGAPTTRFQFVIVQPWVLAQRLGP